jgi:hypothetical protein
MLGMTTYFPSFESESKMSDVQLNVAPARASIGLHVALEATSIVNH